MSTAYNIGLSCNLISKDMKIFYIEGKEIKTNDNFEDINRHEREKVIYTFIKEFKKFKGNYYSMVQPHFSIIIDEKGLFTITENEEMSKIFLSVAKDAKSVICCRVSPIQKSQVVKLIKDYNPDKKTLAIGDGGNDVSMITEAHIGIGIYGEEGLRAVQSSDYAIGEFKILRRLLLFHGYVNLMRNSEMIIYFFYKNFVFTIVHFLYGFFNNFSGQTIIDDWFISLFNLVFTSIPLAVKGVIDIDLNPDDGILVFKLLPFLYLEGRDNPKFSIWKFLLGLIKGIFHCLIDFYFCFQMTTTFVDSKGNFSDIWFNSVNLYTNMLIIVTIDLIVNTKYHTILNFGCIFVITIFLYGVFICIVQYLSIFNSFGTMDVTFKSTKIYLNFFLIGGIIFILELFSLSYDTLFVESVRNYLKLMDDYEKNDDENINENLLDFIDNIGKSENEKSEMAREKEKRKEEEDEEKENELEENLENNNSNNYNINVSRKFEKRRKKGEIYRDITYFNNCDNDDIPSSSREFKHTKNIKIRSSLKNDKLVKSNKIKTLSNSNYSHITNNIITKKSNKITNNNIMISNNNMIISNNNIIDNYINNNNNNNTNNDNDNDKNIKCIEIKQNDNFTINHVRNSNESNAFNNKPKDNNELSFLDEEFDNSNDLNKISDMIDDNNNYYDKGPNF